MIRLLDGLFHTASSAPSSSEPLFSAGDSDSSSVLLLPLRTRRARKARPACRFFFLVGAFLGNPVMLGGLASKHVSPLSFIFTSSSRFCLLPFLHFRSLQWSVPAAKPVLTYGILPFPYHAPLPAGLVSISLFKRSRVPCLCPAFQRPRSSVKDVSISPSSFS